MSTALTIFKLGLVGAGALVCAGWPTLAQAELSPRVMADLEAHTTPDMEGDRASAWRLAFSSAHPVSAADWPTDTVLVAENLNSLSLDLPTLESVNPAMSALDTLTLEGFSPHSPGLTPEVAPEAADGIAQDLMPTMPGLLAADSVPVATPAAANQVAQVRPSNDTAGWEMVLSPYLFVPFNVRSEVTVGGFTQSVSSGLGDIFNLDRVLAGALRFEARRPQYGFFADASYVYVREGQAVAGVPLPPQIAGILAAQTGIPVPPGLPTDAGITATARTTTVSLGGYYRVVDQVLGGPSNTAYPRLLVDPYAGIRLVALSGSADFDVALAGATRSASISDSAVLVKPMVGAQVGLELSPQWALGLRGDISGLAIGADESFAWGLWAGARYRFSPGLAVQLGYQYKDARYRIGSGATQFGIDQNQNGMWLGLDISL